MIETKKSLKEIILFLIYTFSISWFFWLIIIISNKYFDALWYGETLTWILFLLGSLGPAIATYIIYKKNNNSKSLKTIIRPTFRDIRKKEWLIFGIFIIWRFVMVWIAFGIEEPISILYMFLNLPLFIIGGGLEELGWRGYLQPKLEKESNFIVSVIIVGVIWSLWHLPLWLISGTVQSALPFAAYTFLAIILSFSFTTLYKYTKNVFLCVFSHAWFNGCIGLAVYIGSEGYLQLNLNYKVYLVFLLELVISIIFGIKYKYKQSKNIVVES
jgi:membrane protease YdiL (CAAX protease family)